MNKQKYYLNPNTCLICTKAIPYHKRNLFKCCSRKCSGLLKAKENENKYYINQKKCKECNSFLPYEQRNNIFCGNNCAAKYNNRTRDLSWLTDEWKKKQSQKMKTVLPAGWRLNPDYYRKKSIKTRQEQKHLYRTITICAECNKEFAHLKCEKRKYCSSQCSYKNNYHQNSTKLHKCVYKNYKMDSGAEFIFAKILDENNISWVKNSKTFFEYQYQNKIKKYYPDFYLPDYNLWIEIKGKRYIEPWLPNKLQAVKNILLFYSNELKNKNSIIQTIKQNGAE